jgi:hypothetical protein
MWHFKHFPAMHYKMATTIRIALAKLFVKMSWTQIGLAGLRRVSPHPTNQLFHGAATMQEHVEVVMVEQ